jgi:hypothetical protein
MFGFNKYNVISNHAISSCLRLKSVGLPDNPKSVDALQARLQSQKLKTLYDEAKQV